MNSYLKSLISRKEPGDMEKEKAILSHKLSDILFKLQVLF